MSSTPLEYAPKPPPLRRRIVGKVIVFGIELSAGIFLMLWGPALWNRVEILYWQHRCMVYSAPPDQLVFDSQRSTQIVPKEWSSFYSRFSPPGFYSQATIFMHEMKKPDGQKRLVVVDYTPWLFGGTVQLSRVFEPGTAFQRPREFTKRRDLPVSGATGINKVFAGQLDPADSSHFSFRAIQGDNELMYDGWLQNDESVVIGSRAPTK